MQLISIHVPKTAGTSFTNVLTRNYGQERIYLDYGPKRLDAIGPEIQVIHGHFKANRYFDDFPEARMIAWLRHPVSWVISFYYFSKNGPREDGGKLRQILHDEDLSLLEFAEHRLARNVFTRQFMEGVSLNDFFFLGIQEHFGEDLQELGRRMDWRDRETVVSNPNPHSGYRERVREHLSDAALVRRLKALNEADLAAYHHALKLRKKRLRRSPMILLSSSLSRGAGVYRNLIRRPRAA